MKVFINNIVRKLYYYITRTIPDPTCNDYFKDGISV